MSSRTENASETRFQRLKPDHANTPDAMYLDNFPFLYMAVFPKKVLDSHFHYALVQDLYMYVISVGFLQYRSYYT